LSLWTISAGSSPQLLSFVSSSEIRPESSFALVLAKFAPLVIVLPQPSGSYQFVGLQNEAE
jgi:hypothetical protein